MTEEQRKTVGDQMRERLRALPAERFQVVLHREAKEQSVYALAVPVAKKGLAPSCSQLKRRSRQVRADR